MICVCVGVSDVSTARRSADTVKVDDSHADMM